MNYMKTLGLLVLLSIVLVWAGDIMGGPQGASMAFVVAMLLNVGSYWFSDRIVLKMYRAQPVNEAEAPDLHRIVRTLSSRADIPMPKIYITPQDAPNAFATGRSPKHAAVAVTSGLLNIMDEQQLTGVLAHELGHIKNRDTLIMTVAATIAGAITMLASWARWAAIFGGFGGSGRDRNNLLELLLMMIVAPLAALLIQMAISRSREYAADRQGAEIAGTSAGLASALMQMSQYSQARPMRANPATAHMFIVNPLHKRDLVSSLFSTHPPVEERVRRLQEMR